MPTMCTVIDKMKNLRFPGRIKSSSFIRVGNKKDRRSLWWHNVIFYFTEFTWKSVKNRRSPHIKAFYTNRLNPDLVGFFRTSCINSAVRNRVVITVIIISYVRNSELLKVVHYFILDIFFFSSCARFFVCSCVLKKPTPIRRDIPYVPSAGRGPLVQKKKKRWSKNSFPFYGVPVAPKIKAPHRWDSWA